MAFSPLAEKPFTGRSSDLLVWEFQFCRRFEVGLITENNVDI